MRRIEPTNSFKRDYKRELKGKHKTVLGGEFAELLQQLADDQPQAERLRDHALERPPRLPHQT